MKELKEEGTWEVVKRRKEMKVIVIYKLKRSHDRSEVKFKSRLLAQGFAQEYGVNYFSSYAPVVKSSAVRVLIAIAVKKGMRVEQIDIKNAYVNSDLEKEVYIELLRGFEESGEGDQVLKLKKSLYGLKQSGNKWNKCINNVLVNTLKCKRMITESCIYKRGSDENNNLIILALYVDDIILFANNQSEIDTIKEEFEIDNIGECKKDREHMVAAKRVLRYLKGTEDRGVEYTKNSKDIEVYSDADYANDTDDSRSCTGSIVKISGGPVAWERKKQPIVALSSTEAEYMALTSTVKEVTYIRNLLDELNMEEHYGAADIKILCDKNSSISLTKNNGCSPRTKHKN